MSDKPKVHYEKVEINGKITRRKVHCGCTTGGHSKISYLTDEEFLQGIAGPTRYFLGMDKECSKCGFYYFYFVKGGLKANAKYLRK